MFSIGYSTIIPLFIIIGITDVIDGFLARRFGASSRLGAYLDPIADKVLLSGTFLVLALTGAIEPWLAAVVLGRDLLILAAAEFSISPPGAATSAFAVGKNQHVCANRIPVFPNRLPVRDPVGPAVIALKWLTVALAVASLADYARRITTTERH